MDFLSQSWFWAILIPAIVTLGSILIAKIYQIKLERLKLYETDQFKAYNELYKFVSEGYSIWPPNDDRIDYIHLMKTYYFKNIKPNMLYYQPEIRELLKLMETEYHSIDEGDTFYRFFREDFLDTLLKMEQLIEKKIDDLLHKSNFRPWRGL